MNMDAIHRHMHLLSDVKKYGPERNRVNIFSVIVRNWSMKSMTVSCTLSLL